MRLPDEWEWQWAAQSACADRAYPWGPKWREGLANTHETDIHRTTAVGMLLGGCSLQGVYDLAGNVWEWCRNQYDKPRQTLPDGQGSRVLRGGSYQYGRGLAGAVNRVVLPHGRGGGLGFRVVCASPIR